MGWWSQYDGTVIGDELADIVGGHLAKAEEELKAKFPEITRDQILHTMAFCSGGIDVDKLQPNEGLVLQAMPIKDRNEWREEHQIPEDESKLIAPGTGLMNVKSPFSEKVPV